MDVLYSLEDASRHERARGGVVSIGNFDGVHRGHQAMIAVLRGEAERAGVPAVVMTFDPHPIALLAPDRLPPSLSTLERKAELLGRAGADAMVVIRTNRDLLNLSAKAFFDEVLRDRIAASGMVEGPDFHFGRNRGGDVSTLRTLCDDAGMTLRVMEPVLIDGEVVSSSRVRRAIGEGQLGDAVRMLGHPYELRGTIVRGDGRGRTIGYPTANLSGVVTLLPPDGVYAGVAEIDSRTYAAAVNLGGNPTFDVDERKLEVHVIGFDGDLYGCRLSVRLLERVRGTVAFADSAELTSRIARDVDVAQTAAQKHLDSGADPTQPN